MDWPTASVIITVVLSIFGLGGKLTLDIIRSKKETPDIQPSHADLKTHFDGLIASIKSEIMKEIKDIHRRIDDLYKELMHKDHV